MDAPPRYLPDSAAQAKTALRDVYTWLGFGSSDEYFEACDELGNDIFDDDARREWIEHWRQI